jgi:hypothetical protein
MPLHGSVTAAAAMAGAQAVAAARADNSCTRDNRELAVGGTVQIPIMMVMTLKMTMTITTRSMRKAAGVRVVKRVRRKRDMRMTVPRCLT